MSRSYRTTKTCAAAAAGFGMVFASFAGAATSSAGTPRHEHAVARAHARAGHKSTKISPRITPPPPPSPAVTAAATPGTTTVATLEATGSSVAAPTVTVTDPGVIPSGDTITLTLDKPDASAVFDISQTPVVTETGSNAYVDPATVHVNANSITFDVTKGNTAVNATYAVSGIYLTDTSSAYAGGVFVGVTATHQVPGPATITDSTVTPIPFEAVTNLAPAFYGGTAPETAAALFAAHVTTSAPTAVVLASDYEPQDAESANYLASWLPGPSTGILLTNPTTLSPAVTDTFTAYPSITDIYIVGGTSVVSAAIETQLDTQFGADHVIRISGVTAYQTDQALVNYVTSNFGGLPDTVGLDYRTEPTYNHTSGTSSPTTTNTGGDVRTAIVASGSINSFQDGIVSGPLAFYYGMPVVLTSPTSLSDAAIALLTQGGYKQVILLGGQEAVSNSVVDQLTAPVGSGGAGVSVFRVAGTDASDTAQLFAQVLTDVNGDSVSDIGFYTTDDNTDNGGAFITRGTGFQDALAAGAYAGYNAYSPILLTENATTLGAPLTSYLNRIAAEDDTFSIAAIGGPSSVTPGVQADAIAAEVAGLTYQP